MSRTELPPGVRGHWVPHAAKSRVNKLRLEVGVENLTAFVEQLVRVCICILLDSKTHVKQVWDILVWWILRPAPL